MRLTGSGDMMPNAAIWAEEYPKCACQRARYRFRSQGNLLSATSSFRRVTISSGLRAASRRLMTYSAPGSYLKGVRHNSIVLKLDRCIVPICILLG